MKKLLILTICLLSITSVSSQKRRTVDNLPTLDERKFRFGFYLGVNKNDFKVNLKPSNFLNASIEVKPSPGFNVGLIADLRLHKNINLRFEPGLMSNSKTIFFNHLLNERDSVREIGSTYLHLPLVLKFSTDRWNNVRPYVIGGISYDHNFSSNQDNPDDNLGGQFRLKSTNFMYEVGIGIDIYLYYFKFSPSIRGIFAMNNELVYDNDSNSQWTSPINTITTRGIFLNFSFEGGW